ncbi:Septin [Pyrenophora tritici-repentis]|nr:Septin [Pyrenophora tritici-repentis]KAI0582274.1 Septin [Pyrenophora tritici-repentis]KAI0585389.1 Septin [Pyrenophora tritici-repentis]KAI0609042.1 Septin [Pyrenophora tritici-repentis]KAI0624267.1 Septin [Pyrenophora tritici-repentis]
MASTDDSRSSNPSLQKNAALDSSLSPAAAQSSSQSSADQGGTRRSSFNFLRRSSGKSSSEIRGSSSSRSTSVSKMSRKQKALAQEEALRKQREASMLPRQPPRLPSHSALPQIATFGGEDHRPDSIAIVSNKAGAYNTGVYTPNALNFSRPGTDAAKVTRQQSPAVGAPAVGSSPPPSNYMDYDPYPRTESMTNRGRYSYASSQINTVNSPRRVRRRKDPTPFNILVIGTKNAGKSCFIDFLRTALALPARKRPHTPSPPATAVGGQDSPFTSEFLETEVDGERVGVTLWDSEGLEKNIVDFQLPAITAFLESKFEETFSEEQKVVRAPGVKDTHIHCVFLILDPVRLDQNIAEARKKSNLVNIGSAIFGGLDENLDLNVLRELQSRTTVIPVISKADTITDAHMRYLKKTVWDTIKREGEGEAKALNKILERSSSDAARSMGSSGSSTKSHSPPTSPPSAKRSHARKPSAISASIQGDDVDSPFLPLSIISPDPYDPEVIGRRFPWGFADPYNPEHCDFVKLREYVFSDWRSELREASREQWYEGWRTTRLEQGRRRVVTSHGPASKGLSVPTANGRATSAGNQDSRPYRPNQY